MYDLALDACLGAIADAGLRPDDIDGLAPMAAIDVTRAPLVQDALGLKVGWMGHWGVTDAVMAVAAGFCTHVLAYRSVHMLPGTFGNTGDFDWATPFHEYSAASLFAMHAMRHMHLYGTTKEQLGWIPLTCRFHAGLNPDAALRTPLTLDDYLNARKMCDPLGLLDCDIPVDGAVALVISAADFAPDCPHPMVRFEAVGTANHGRNSWHLREDLPSMAAEDAAAQMWGRTDLKPADVDVAQLYDGFSFMTLSWLEALGFCAKGEGGPFVEGGDRIRLGGTLPLNTYGGQLSAGRLHGYWQLHEAVVQLRGTAGDRQVPNAEVAVTSTFGGPNGFCYLLTKG